MDYSLDILLFRKELKTHPSIGGTDAEGLIKDSLDDVISYIKEANWAHHDIYLEKRRKASEYGGFIPKPPERIGIDFSEARDIAVYSGKDKARGIFSRILNPSHQEIALEIARWHYESIQNDMDSGKIGNYEMNLDKPEARIAAHKRNASELLRLHNSAELILNRYEAGINEGLDRCADEGDCSSMIEQIFEYHILKKNVRQLAPYFMRQSKLNYFRKKTLEFIGNREL